MAFKSRFGNGGPIYGFLASIFLGNTDVDTEAKVVVIYVTNIQCRWHYNTIEASTYSLDAFYDNINHNYDNGNNV